MEVRTADGPGVEPTKCCCIRNGSALCFYLFSSAELLRRSRTESQAERAPTSSGGMVEVWLYQNHAHAHAHAFHSLI